MKRNRTAQEIATMRVEFARDIEQGRLTLSEATTAMRHVVGKTIPEYAKILKVSQRTLSDVENEAGNPTLDTLKKIAKPFGLRVTFAPALEEDRHGISRHRSK